VRLRRRYRPEDQGVKRAPQMPIYQGTVSNEQRLQRLRELVAQLERLPASADRERMLREVRGRLVDLDTGVAPRAMLPIEAEAIDAADPVPRAVRAPRPRPPLPARAAPRPRPVPPPDPPKPVDPTSLGVSDLLSLDDPAPPPPREERPERRGGPWTRGLRG
jgi:hypothetical protein